MSEPNVPYNATRPGRMQLVASSDRGRPAWTDAGVDEMWKAGRRLREMGRHIEFTEDDSGEPVMIETKIHRASQYSHSDRRA